MTARRAQPARPSPSVSIRLLGNPSGLEQVFLTYEAFARAHALPDDVRRDMYVALEEIVSNVVRHGRRRPLPRISLTLTVSRGRFHVDVIDDGAAFDPFSVPEPDVSQPLLDRPIGGLGVLFVGRLTDRHTYRRVRRRNHVQLTRRLTARTQN